VPLISRVLDVAPVRSLEHYLELGGGAAWRVARQESPRDIIDLLSAAGLRGRGGAGFPTGRKWQTVADSKADVLSTTVVVNAAEGEPGTFKDRALLRTNPYRVLEGAIIAAITMQAPRVRIGIKASFTREIERLHAAIAEMRHAGWAPDIDIQLALGPSSYLFGEETALLEVLEGRQPFPRVAPPYRRGLNQDDSRSAVGAPLASTGGSAGAPALVDNVETLANVPLIVDRGSEWFRDVGTERSPGTIVCTVSGATRRSGVGELPMGATLREAIELVGWGPRPGHQVQVVLAGTANALIPARHLETPLTYEAMQEIGSGLGSAGFIVFDETTDPAAIAAGVLRFLSVESCGQCEPCKTDGLFIAERVRQSVREPLTSGDLSALRRRVGTVTIGARCNLAQQQAAVASSLLELFPPASGAAGARPSRAGSAPVLIAPIGDIVAGRALLDTNQATKQPDWSHDASDSGTPPAARLANTPVRVVGPGPSREWPEWSSPGAGGSGEQPLQIVDDAHDAICRSIDRALAAGEHDTAHRDEVVLAVRRHIDVTQRVLYPMVRRIGGEEGDRLADRAEEHERVLTRLIDGLAAGDDGPSLLDLGVEVQVHADLEDGVLELLRARLAVNDRAGLADGLATAITTSTVRSVRPQADVGATAALRALLPSQDRATGPGPAAAPVDHETRSASSPTVPEEVRATPVVLSPPPGSAPSAPTPEADPGPRRPGPSRVGPSPVGQILVGVDGSEAAAAALGWAGRLARRVGGEVVVANVFEAEQAELSPGEVAVLRGEAEVRLRDEWSTPLRGIGVPHRTLQLTGATDALLAAAESEGTELVVVGTRGPGRHAALHFGSRAHRLARHSRGPLAIVPFAGADASLDRVLLSVDGAAGSQSALAWIAEVAPLAGVEVTIVSTFDPGLIRKPRAAARAWREAVEGALSREWAASLRAAGVTARTRVIEAGHPVPALAAIADEEGAGWIVIGTQGLSEAAGLRFGRIPVQLVHHTHLPVVLIPPPCGRSSSPRTASP
jgi:NADH:ubiquinone oxidoreductase subunit F (NADH-binding)/nucleotide-binding universal stress UspA family protein